MKIEVERICNGLSAPYWYGVCFFVENGKPNMVEGRLPSAVTETEEQGKRTKAALVAAMENFAKEKRFDIPLYPDKDKTRGTSRGAKKHGLSQTQIVNDALKHIGTVGSVAALSAEIEKEMRLARMIELAKKAGYFFPSPPKPQSL